VPNLAFSDVPFLYVIVIANTFLVSASSEARYHFISFLSSVIQSLPYESRGRALTLLLDPRPGSIQLAFLYSLADSNDNRALDSIFRQYTKLD
jgi:hypothetical protein